jgi:hypothetical protein
MRKTYKTITMELGKPGDRPTGMEMMFLHTRRAAL